MLQPFSPTLLVEVEYGQHKYGGCLHSPSYVCGERRRALDECARSPHLAGPDGAGWGEASRGMVKDAGA